MDAIRYWAILRCFAARIRCVPEHERLVYGFDAQVLCALIRAGMPVLYRYIASLVSSIFFSELHDLPQSRQVGIHGVYNLIKCE